MDFKWEAVKVENATGDVEQITKNFRKIAKSEYPGSDYKIECEVLSCSLHSERFASIVTPVLKLMIKMPYTGIDAMQELYNSDFADMIDYDEPEPVVYPKKRKKK